jgi:DNA-binding transcriptional LysR family regulator
MTKDLEVFLAVAEAASFSAAARRLDLAVSSVTRRIDSLEHEFGARLFLRGSRRLLLTDAGQTFLESARRVVEELAQVRQRLALDDPEPRGTLTIAAPAAFGRRHVAPAVHSFMARHPGIEVELQVSDTLIDLAAERVDLAIRVGRPSGSELVASRLAPMRRIVCAAPTYLERAGYPRSPKDLLRHQCLTVQTKPTPQGWWTFPGIHRGAPLPVRGRLRSDDTETLLQAALAGLGIVHLASWMVGDHLAAGRLIPLLTDARPIPPAQAPAIHAVRLPGRSHAARARLFIHHLREHFGTPPYWDRASQRAAP